MIERIDPRIVPVAPVDADRVAAHLFHVQHLERGLEHRERALRLRRIIRLLRLRAVCAGATGAGAFVAQVSQRILAAMRVLPIDLDALGFLNRDVFGLGNSH